MILFFHLVLCRHDDFNLEISNFLLFKLICNRGNMFQPHEEENLEDFKRYLIKWGGYCRKIKEILEKEEEKIQSKDFLIKKLPSDNFTYEFLMGNIKSYLNYLIVENKELYFTEEEISMLKNKSSNLFDLFRTLVDKSMMGYSYGMLLLCLGMVIETNNSQYISLLNIEKIVIDYYKIKESKFLAKVRIKLNENIH
ncbi:hypothetical protein H312_03619 [Anncaliia algerae PRA339]|uniref:Uncharacterized protein n=1 Tax=Anncaliia algerae PRA339 TaxID=1288291 RepID=A0A059EW75_9MICR|nr:hypothetical protein H312_03619 [Anncaliia algerae PRA339]